MIREMLAGHVGEIAFGCVNEHAISQRHRVGVAEDYGSGIERMRHGSSELSAQNGRVCSEPRYAEPTRAKPKIGRPGGMPTISTVAQGGAQRSEQYLEARTGRGARADDRQPAQVL